MRRLAIGHRVRLPWFVLIFGMWVSIITMAQWRLEAHRVKDLAASSANFIPKVKLEVTRQANGAMQLKYRVCPARELTGSWIATVQTPEGVRLATRRGPGTYRPNDCVPRAWSWGAFFDEETLELPAPVIPRDPFKVCVFYTIKTLDTGVSKTTDDFCSQVFGSAAGRKSQ